MAVEDYEDYYKKQKADSNCGFAEEFEVKMRLEMNDRFLAGDHFYCIFDCYLNLYGNDKSHHLV